MVKYPLYINLPVTGSVRSVFPDKSNEIMKTVDLSWNNDAIESVCDGRRRPVHSRHRNCLGEDAYRNASAAAGTSFGADLGWFKVAGDCTLERNEMFHGLCFMVANDMVANNAAGLTSTLVAGVDDSACPAQCVTPRQWHTFANSLVLVVCPQLGWFPFIQSSCFTFPSRSELCWRRRLKNPRRSECE